jgi:hypothetical protein
MKKPEGKDMIEQGLALLPKAIELIPKFLELFKGKEPAPISFALATGYYCNFLCPLYTQLSTGSFVVIPKDKTKAPAAFTARDVSVTILLPREFDKDTWVRCDEEYRILGPDEGAFNWITNNRDYSFRYKLSRGGGKQYNLMIVDVARPLFAVETFHRQVKHFKATKKPEISANEWERIQAREVEGFTAAIDYLWKNSSFTKLKKPGFLHL